MEEQELKHYLSVLIELNLFPILEAVTEYNLSKEEIEKEQQIEIINFINDLPEQYKKIENRDEIIAGTLKRMGMNTLWGEKKIEEIEMMKKRQTRNKETHKEKIKDNEIEK